MRMCSVHVHFLKIRIFIERRIAGESVDARLKRALAMKGNLIFVTGASKSGKTVLCHNVIAEDKYVGLSGNRIGSKEDFWNHLAEQIPLSDSIVTTSSEQTSNASGNNMGVNVELRCFGYSCRCK